VLNEQRLLWVDQVANHRSHDANIISFGSESCAIPFLDINNHWDVFLNLFDLGVRLKVVTPRISQNELAETINLLSKIINLQREIDIVINDWGLLQFCLKNKDHLNVHIGRQLCRSLLDCPWHQEILDNESTEVGAIISSHPYSSVEKIKALCIQGVKGLELNALFRGFDFQPILDFHLEIAVHLENYLLTCGRTCLSKRIITDKACFDICEEIFQLEPSGKWLNYFENREAFSGYEKSMLSGLAINGKKATLPQKVNIDDILSSGINVVITTQTKSTNLLKGAN